jgi:hypothetical protein
MAWRGPGTSGSSLLDADRVEQGGELFMRFHLNGATASS